MSLPEGALGGVIPTLQIEALRELPAEDSLAPGNLLIRLGAKPLGEASSIRVKDADGANIPSKAFSKNATIELPIPAEHAKNPNVTVALVAEDGALVAVPPTEVNVTRREDGPHLTFQGRGEMKFALVELAADAPPPQYVTPPWDFAENALTIAAASPTALAISWQSPGGSVAKVRVMVGTARDEVSSGPCAAPDAFEVPVSQGTLLVSGLTPATAYFARVCTLNSRRPIPDASAGVVRAVTTPPALTPILHVAYSSGISNALSILYATRSGGDWAASLVETLDGANPTATMALDRSGKPVIFLLKRDGPLNWNVTAARRDAEGAWQVETETSILAGFYPVAVTLDRDELPAIASYSDFQTYFSRKSAGGWPAGTGEIILNGFTTPTHTRQSLTLGASGDYSLVGLDGIVIRQTGGQWPASHATPLHCAEGGTPRVANVVVNASDHLHGVFVCRNSDTSEDIFSFSDADASYPAQKISTRALSKFSALYADFRPSSADVFLGLAPNGAVHVVYALGAIDEATQKIMIASNATGSFVDSEVARLPDDSAIAGLQMRFDAVGKRHIVFLVSSASVFSLRYVHDEAGTWSEPIVIHSNLETNSFGHVNPELIGFEIGGMHPLTND